MERSTDNAGAELSHRLCGSLQSIFCIWALVIAMIFPEVSCCVCSAADKSGVTPNTISLPTGPGSIEGLGESFEPTLNTGTAKYAVGLKVPPGTAGHAPDLSLSYDGGGSNGPLGFGWKMEVPYVQRQTDKGIPRYIDGNNGVDDDLDGVVDNPEEIDVFINEIGEELVLTVDGYYFCENEGAFVRYRKVDDHWEAHLPDGTLLEFGLTPSGRVTDADNGRVFKWLLERRIDTNGNTIIYKYTSGSGSENTNEVYPAAIEYGPGAPPWDNYHFAVFVYEDRKDWFEDCRAGFVIRTGKRLMEIIIGTHGPELVGHASGDLDGDGGVDYLDRMYVLSYDAHPHWSLLTSVEWVGADGVSIYPPITFGYTVSNPPDSISAAGKAIGSLNEPVSVMDNSLVDLVDMNADGLPDILRTDYLGGPHRVSLNQGETVSGGITVISWKSAAEVGGDQRAWGINLSSSSGNVAHLADMDADGLADLVYKTESDVYYFPNLGNGNWGQRLLMNKYPYDSAPPSPFGSDDVKTADIDFDKNMDIIQSVSVGDGADYRIWFNTGRQRFSKSMTSSQDQGYMFSLSGVQIADFNGDRVPDIVRIRPSSIEVTAGLGRGRFAPMARVLLSDYTLDSSQVEKAKLQDINGDGLVDLVIERAAPGLLWYWLNLGNYVLDKRRIITGMPTGIGLNPAIRWADLNGNGSTDLVYADSSYVPRIRAVDIGRLIGCVPRPNILISINNGIGGKTSIEYESSTKFLLDDAAKGHRWPDPLPFAVSVVSKMSVDDSMGNVYSKEFSYHDGYYDGAEKEFRGFAAVGTRETGDESEPDLIMAFSFDTGAQTEALKGKPLRLEAKDRNNGVFYVEQNGWSTRTLYVSASGDSRKVTFPFQNDRVRDVLERGNGAPVQIKWEYEYDDYGNMIRQMDYGRMDDGWDDERITLTSYTSGYPDGQNRWILRSVVESRFTDENGVMAAHSRNYYDGNSSVGMVSKGNLTMTENWVRGDQYIKSVRNNYDSYGNITVMRDPLYGIQPGHYRELIYDPLFHAFPEQEIIYTGNANINALVYKASYDAGFGVVTSATEFNGYTTTYGYDAFARLTTITKPPDTDHTIEYVYVLANDAGEGRIINWTETLQRDGSDGDGFLHSRSFFDGLGRKIMTRSEGETPGQIVASDTVKFNARRQPWRKYLPYFEAGTLEYSAPAFNTGYTEHFYDELGREIRVNQPVVDGEIVYATTGYSPLLRTVRDENQTNPGSQHYGNGRLYIEDGLMGENNQGRLCKVIDIVRLSDSGESTAEQVNWVSSYKYNILSDLTAFDDSQGNERMFAYDGLRRKTLMNDTDRGIMRYRYDEASNMTGTTDAKGQKITYAYDGVNRLVSEDYHDEGLPFSANRSPDVEYHYDISAGTIDLGDTSSGTAQNTKGRLSWVRDLSGEEHTSYDERGRESWVVKIIQDPATGLPVSYRTGMIFDSMDRVKTLVYPDNDRVSYVYNPRGLIGAVSGGPQGSLVSGLTYNPSGQISHMLNGNGIHTAHEYDERLRLSSIKTFREGKAGQPLLFYGYAMDGVSNILRINDLRPDTIATAGNARRNTQIFGYDDLYRLNAAMFSFALPGDPDNNNGSISYRYDRIGNMLSKTSDINHVINGYSVTNIGQMNYGGAGGRSNRTGRDAGDAPGPHALTTTDNGTDKRDIAYDDNGNITALEGKTYIWDFKDRLSAVEDEKMRTMYIYDYTDRRITKKVRPK